jgi:hypothetical protein
VRSLQDVVRALPHSVPQVDPPLALRQRVLAVAGARPASAAVTGPVRPARAAEWVGWAAAAALLVVAAGLGIYVTSLRQQLQDVELRLVGAVVRLEQSEQQLAQAVGEMQVARTRLAVLTAGDLTEVNLAGQAPAPRASGRAFLSRSRGVLFAASNLPPLPANRTYQLWFLTTGPPVSAGLFQPDQEGGVTAAFDTLTDALSPTGVAVSLEPEGGVPAPTGAIYLVGQTQ